MMETQNDVCAQTQPATPAQRRAGRIADAMVLANKTFGRDALAALDGTWHADDACAELRFTLNGQACWLAQDRIEWNMAWVVGCLDSTVHQGITVPPGTPVAVAAERLREALDDLRRSLPGQEPS